MRSGPGQAVLRAGLPGLVFLALLQASAARGGCPEWADLEVTQGELTGFGPGPVAWRIGHRPLHGQHRDTRVELRWTLRGAEVRQVLFSEIQDGAVRLRRHGDRLLLRAEYCPRGGECRVMTLPYRWDAAQGRFAGLSGEARRALEQACPPGTDPPR